MNRLGIFSLLCSVLAASAGCGAAKVIFDVPESAETIESAASTGAAQPQGNLGSSPVRDPLPAELTLDPDSVLALLPRDQAGGVDWVAALEDGTLDPRRNPTGAPAPPGDFGYDFFFGEMETEFPHSSHSAWLSCTSCHPEIYRTRGEKTTMADISNGESCGVCHGTVAFPVDVCERCHPAANLPEGRLEPRLDTEATIPRDTTSENARNMGSLPESLFPHWVHRIRYACSACHPKPFAMEPGATQITMEEMQAGQTCGMCHGNGDTFGVMECTRCHRSPEGLESG